jgi:hypothetical protein
MVGIGFSAEKHGGLEDRLHAQHARSRGSTLTITLRRWREWKYDESCVAGKDSVRPWLDGIRTGRQTGFPRSEID